MWFGSSRLGFYRLYNFALIKLHKRFLYVSQDPFRLLFAMFVFQNDYGKFLVEFALTGNSYWVQVTIPTRTIPTSTIPTLTIPTRTCVTNPNPNPNPTCATCRPRRRAPPVCRQWAYNYHTCRNGGCRNGACRNGACPPAFTTCG